MFLGLRSCARTAGGDNRLRLERALELLGIRTPLLGLVESLRRRELLPQTGTPCGNPCGRPAADTAAFQQILDSHKEILSKAAELIAYSKEREAVADLADQSRQDFTEESAK